MVLNIEDLKSMPKAIIATGMILLSIGKYVDLESATVVVATIMSWILTMLTNYFNSKIDHLDLKNESLRLEIAVTKEKVKRKP